MELQNRISTAVVASAIFLSANIFAYDEIVEPTGIDQIIEVIHDDARLKRKASEEDIEKATESIKGMNALIKEAIKEQGLANDGELSISDVRDVNSYLASKYESEWRELRGQYSKEDPSGYYLVEKRGATTIAMGSDALRIWGYVYDLGFPTDNKHRLKDYKGSNSGSFGSVGYYLSEIMAQDIATGELYNQEYQEVIGTTGTSLDLIIEAIMGDQGLHQKIATSDIREGSKAADSMNHLIIEAIKAEGLANDYALSTADIREINRYLVEHHKEKWAELHGDDENDMEWGYHLVQNDGAYSRMFADNVVNSIADGIYHLGFYTDDKNRLLNEDGNKNKSFEKVAWWLDTILRDDLEAGLLVNPDYQEVVGTTGTMLDKIVPYIFSDEGLLLKVSTGDIREATRSANGMNELLVEAIINTGVATDDFISYSEVGVLNEYLSTNYAAKWAELHGDDEDDGKESGYHLIQNNGAKGRAYGNENVINKLADGVYHLGFPTDYENRLVNEDGNKNASFKSVAYWLNKAFQEDYAKGVFK